VSTRIDGAIVTVTVRACATLSAGTVHMSLTACEGPAPGIWQYNLDDETENRAGRGRIAGKTDHLDVLRYAAGYQPGTPERGLLEQFAADASPRYSPGGSHHDAHMYQGTRWQGSAS
jgi:hypothetical protein